MRFTASVICGANIPLGDEQIAAAYLCVVSVFEVSGKDERASGWNFFQCIIPGIMSCSESQAQGPTRKGSVW